MFAKLKRGDFDNQYQEVEVYNTATPNVLLQPQNFANSTFPEISFIEEGDGIFSMIILSNTADVQKRAYATFTSGINSLEGLPKDYIEYIVDFEYSAIPVHANIDTILGWKMAQKLTVRGKESMVLTFSERIDELSKLSGLSELQFDIGDNSYLGVDVGTFIAKLPTLKAIPFHGQGLTVAELKKLIARNEVPSNWRGSLTIYSIIIYRKIEA